MDRHSYLELLASEHSGRSRVHLVEDFYQSLLFGSGIYLIVDMLQCLFRQSQCLCQQLVIWLRLCKIKGKFSQSFVNKSQESSEPRDKCDHGKLPFVVLTIASMSRGYLVIRCVTNKMHSGIPRFLAMLFWVLHFWKIGINKRCHVAGHICLAYLIEPFTFQVPV